MLSRLISFDRNDRGQVLAILLFTILWIWAVVIMTWNTGAVVSSKVRHQTAADTAAWSAATTMSRTTNMITATNTIIIRCASVEALAVAAAIMTVKVAINLGQATIAAWATTPVGWLALAKIAQETAAMFNLVGGAIDDVVSAAKLELHERIGELHDLQNGIVMATPKTIDDQRKSIGRFHNCSILLSQPGSVNVTQRGVRGGPGRVLAPVRPATIKDELVIAEVLTRRILRDRKGWADYLGKYVTIGRGRQEWDIALVVGEAAALLSIGNRCYVLTSTNVTEQRPTRQQRIDDFSVIAVAYGPGPQRTLVMPGLFGHGVNPRDTVMAFAQAETYNGFDVDAGFLGQVVDALLPWRVWQINTGWHWQPRLSLSDGLRRAYDKDKKLQSLLRSRLRIGRSEAKEMDRAIAH